MLISHKYRFIYIKTGKVGGTSLEMALSKFMGPGDVITPVTWEDELERYRRGFPTPQNFEKPFVRLKPTEWGTWLKAQAGTQFRSGEGRLRSYTRLPRRFWNHMPAEAVRAEVGPEIWNSYFKFAVERNPWDKVVSKYYWDPKGKKKEMSFRDYVTSGRGCTSNFHYYSINGQVAVDRLIRYDDLEGGLGEVSERLGLPENAHDVMRTIGAKSGYRRTRDYRDLYDDELREIVATHYAREIHLLGFEF